MCIVEVEGRVQAEVVFLPSKVVEGCNLMEGVCMHLDHSAPTFSTLKGTASDKCVLVLLKCPLQSSKLSSSCSSPCF